MYRLCSLALGLTLGLALAACSAPTGSALTAPPNDAEAIIGAWQIVALWDSGREAPADAIAGWQMTFTPDSVVYDLGGALINAAYSLDPTASPMHIDIEISGRGTWQGIYALADDTLKIVTPDSFDPASSTRSTAFESEPESANDWYAILTRQ